MTSRTLDALQEQIDAARKGKKLRKRYYDKLNEYNEQLPKELEQTRLTIQENTAVIDQKRTENNILKKRVKSIIETLSNPPALREKMSDVIPGYNLGSQLTVFLGLEGDVRCRDGKNLQLLGYGIWSDDKTSFKFCEYDKIFKEKCKHDKEEREREREAAEKKAEKKAAKKAKAAAEAKAAAIAEAERAEIALCEKAEEGSEDEEDVPTEWTHDSYDGDETIYKDDDGGVYRISEEMEDYEIIGFYDADTDKLTFD
jgi:hypothetical protein